MRAPPRRRRHRAARRRCSHPAAHRLAAHAQEVPQHRMAVLAEDRLGVELHAFERRGAAGQAAVAHAHDLAVFRGRGDLELGRQRLALDRQRVVADHRDALGQPVVDALPVVRQHAGLAVHLPLRADHPAAERRADRLMAEAHAEDRPPAGEVPDQVDADARLGRRARPRRKNDALGRQRLDAGEVDLVVAHHLHRLAQLAEVLHEVEGEGVVVVDHEQHGCSVRLISSDDGRPARLPRRSGTRGVDSPAGPARDAGRRNAVRPSGRRVDQAAGLRQRRPPGSDEDENETDMPGLSSEVGGRAEVPGVPARVALMQWPGRQRHAATTSARPGTTTRRRQHVGPDGVEQNRHERGALRHGGFEAVEPAVAGADRDVVLEHFDAGSAQQFAQLVGRGEVVAAVAQEGLQGRRSGHDGCLRRCRWKLSVVGRSVLRVTGLSDLMQAAASRSSSPARRRTDSLAAGRRCPDRFRVRT